MCQRISHKIIPPYLEVRVGGLRLPVHDTKAGCSLQSAPSRRSLLIVDTVGML